MVFSFFFQCYKSVLKREPRKHVARVRCLEKKREEKKKKQKKKKKKEMKKNADKELCRIMLHIRKKAEDDKVEEK